MPATLSSISSKPSTRYSDLRDFEAVVALGRTEIEQMAANVKRVSGRFCDENLDFLRRAWKASFATAVSRPTPRQHKCPECGEYGTHELSCAFF